MLTSVKMNKATRSRTRQARSRGCYLGHRSLQDHVPHRQGGCTKYRCYHHQNIWSACWTVGGKMQEKADPVSVARHHGTHLTWSATQKSLVVTSHHCSHSVTRFSTERMIYIPQVQHVSRNLCRSLRSLGLMSLKGTKTSPRDVSCPETEVGWVRGRLEGAVGWSRVQTSLWVLADGAVDAACVSLLSGRGVVVMLEERKQQVRWSAPSSSLISCPERSLKTY